MHYLKRVISIITIVAMVVMGYPVVPTVNASEGDSTPPVIDLEGIVSSKPDSISLGQTFVMSVPVTDDSEILDVGLTYTNIVDSLYGQKKYNEQTMSFDGYNEETGMYEFEVSASLYGPHEILSIYATDVYGNTVTYIDKTNQFYSKWGGEGIEYDFSRFDFAVESSITNDLQGPVIDISSIVVSNSTPKLNEHIMVSVPISDPTGIKDAEIGFSNGTTLPCGSLKDISPEGVYNFEVYSSEYGDYELTYVRATDYYGNKTYYQNLDSKYVEWLEPGATNADLSSGNFIIESVGDTEAPIVDLSSLTLTKKTVSRNEKTVLSLKATDNVGITEIYVTHPNKLHQNIAYGVYNESTGYYDFELASEIYGDVCVAMISVRDASGNSVNYVDSNAKYPCYIGINEVEADFSEYGFCAVLKDEATGVCVSNSTLGDDATLTVSSKLASGEEYLQMTSGDAETLGFYDITVGGTVDMTEESSKVFFDMSNNAEVSNGDTVRVSHLKHDGTVQVEECVVKNQLVEIDVNEFSPFLLESTGDGSAENTIDLAIYRTSYVDDIERTGWHIGFSDELIEDIASVVDDETTLWIYENSQDAFTSFGSNEVTVGTVILYYDAGEGGYTIPSNITINSLKADYNVTSTGAYIYTRSIPEIYVYSGNITVNGNVDMVTLGDANEVFVDEDGEDIICHTGDVCINGNVGNVSWHKKTSTIDPSRYLVDKYDAGVEAKSIEEDAKTAYYEGDLSVNGNIINISVKEGYYHPQKKFYMLLEKASLFDYTTSGLEKIIDQGELTENVKYFEGYNEKAVIDWLPSDDNISFQYQCYYGDIYGDAYYWMKQIWVGDDYDAGFTDIELPEGAIMPEESLAGSVVTVYGTSEEGLNFESDNIPESLTICSGVVNVDGDLAYLNVQDLTRYWHDPGKITVNISGNIEIASIEGTSKNTNISVDGNIDLGLIMSGIDENGVTEMSYFTKSNLSSNVVKNGTLANNIFIESGDGDSTIIYQVATSLEDIENAIGLNDDNRFNEETGCYQEVCTSVSLESVDIEATQSELENVLGANESVTGDSIEIELYTYSHVEADDREYERDSNVTETAQSIAYRVKIPSYSAGNSYGIIRKHKNEDGTYSYDPLDVTVENGFVTFESDKFSSFLITCRPEVELDIEVGENTPDTKIEEFSDEELDSILAGVLTQEEKDAINDGAFVELKLTVDNISDTIDAEDKEQIAEAANELSDNAEVVMYLDLKLFKQLSTETTETPVTDTNGTNIAITIDVPEDIKNSDPSVNRTYYVARMHEGEVDLLPVVYDAEAGTITFETSKFSTYALVYMDGHVHDYDTNYTVDVEATCTTKGSKSRHCKDSACDAKIDVTEIVPLGHDMTRTVSSKQNPTCETAGKEAVIGCSRCNLTEGGAVIPALGHSMTKTISSKQNPTCETAGKDVVIGCSRCSHTEGGAVIPALGHNYSSEYTVDRAPTATLEGSKSRHCTRCDAKTDVTSIARTAPETVSVKYRTHVQNVGWQNYVSDGVMSGTSGRSLRLEGINISLDTKANLGVTYTTHVQNIGWQTWRSNGEMAGTSGQSLRLEAIKIQLTGADAGKYDIYYRVHCQNIGWMGWAKNGAAAGTAGFAYRLEGIQIVVTPKNAGAPSTSLNKCNQNTSKAYINKSKPMATDDVVAGANNVFVNYRTHVQNVGWQKYVSNGAMSGTSGRSLRLEGINIELTNKPYSGGITYQTHIQNIGWNQGWKTDGAMAGTSGQSLRLEAIRIKLYGEMANHYDVYYRVHCQNIGWMGWAKNGEDAGSAGYSYRLEGIQIVLVPKGGAAPGATYNGITQKTSEKFRNK